jgi:hypothetical protein
LWAALALEAAAEIANAACAAELAFGVGDADDLPEEAELGAGASTAREGALTARAGSTGGATDGAARDGAASTDGAAEAGAALTDGAVRGGSAVLSGAAIAVFE